MSLRGEGSLEMVPNAHHIIWRSMLFVCLAGLGITTSLGQGQSLSGRSPLRSEISSTCTHDLIIIKMLRKKGKATQHDRKTNQCNATQLAQGRYFSKKKTASGGTCTRLLPKFHAHNLYEMRWFHTYNSVNNIIVPWLFICCVTSWDRSANTYTN